MGEVGELNDRLIGELIDAVRRVLRKEASERLRDVYLIGDIEKDLARTCIERLRELATSPRVSALVDHDSRAGQMGWMAIDNGCGATPGAAQADAGSDLQNPGVAFRQAAAPNHQGHKTD